MTDHSESIHSQQSGHPAEHIESDERTRSLTWLARVAGVTLSTVSLGFVLLLLVVIESGGELTLITRPFLMQVVLTLPYLIGFLTVGTTAGAVLAWWHRYWSRRVRIHHTLLAVLGLGFSWQLVRLGFITL
ncbi:MULTISPECIES: hypothetical protein [Haloferacaceae]|uniref:Uncharacterized protein n=1 Tax=Halorubrum glutamatedens TaxID=2707018 RepID=A0ABD5QWV6_9EURY|nr:hypothetical protein [Halobellus captivus]